MSYKRPHDDLDFEPTVPKRKLEEIQLLSANEQQLSQQQSLSQSRSQSQPQQSLLRQSSASEVDHKDMSEEKGFGSDLTDELMSCESESQSELMGNAAKSVTKMETMTDCADSEEEDDYDTDPDIIIPYLNRFQESYESSLSIYSCRLEKLELSDALKCTNDLFAVAIDNYQKEHNGFQHKTQIDLSGVQNVRREFDLLLIGSHHPNVNSSNTSTDSITNCSNSYNTYNTSKTNTDMNTSTETNGISFSYAYSESPYPFNHYNSYIFDDKLAKVIAFMCRIERKICLDMKEIYVSYERLLESLIMIEYRLSIIIEMFHHMTDIEPQKFLPSLPFIQNVPDLIGYINSLYDEDNELHIKDESSNERMQAIVNQFRAMHKRIRDAMDGLHALSCIIMEKKTEVIDRVHTFYKKAEQIFFSQPSFVFQTKDNTSRCL